MAGVQYPNHDGYPTVARTPSPNLLTKLAPSADRLCKMRPALLLVPGAKLPKKVRWAPGTVYNEKRVMTPPAKPSGAKPTCKVASPNTSAKIHPSLHSSVFNQGHQNRLLSPHHRRRGSSETKSSLALPPRVPDAPRPRPPPAPRPARLPTPDLPEIDGAFFLSASDIGQKPVLKYSKMDAQLEAAMAHMNQGKKRR